MTPFELDGIINPEIKKKQKKDAESISEIKRKTALLGDIFEDDEDGDFGLRLYDAELDEMLAEQKNQILLGKDLDEEET